MLYWLKEREKVTTISIEMIIAIKIKDNDANKVKIDDFDIGQFGMHQYFSLIGCIIINQQKIDLQTCLFCFVFFF